MKEKRFVIWKRCDEKKDPTQIFDMYFTGTFNGGSAEWTVLLDRAAHYVESAACLLAKSLGESIREVKE